MPIDQTSQDRAAEHAASASPPISDVQHLYAMLTALQERITILEHDVAILDGGQQARIRRVQRLLLTDSPPSP